MSEDQVPVKNKRIIVCCDGTWLNSDNGYNEKTHVLENPSNVTRFARAVRPVTKDGTPQITYYQAGVGSGYDFIDVYLGGATGSGLDEHIREAYAFIVQNYVEGDKIILLGFSRGAFTARSIAGLIATVGLLTRSGMAHFYRIFKDYQNMNIPKDKYVNPVPGLDIPEKYLPIGAHPKDYPAWLRNYTNPRTGLPERLTSTEIPKIAAIGVWDTVGSLGVPSISFVDNIKRMMKMKVPQDELRFYDTKLSSNVLNAFQALALDEMRYSFQPAVWEKTAGLPTKLKQVWFPGVHSNIGGGEAEQELQDITLAWMMSQMREACDIEFDEVYAQFLFGRTAPVPNYRNWSSGLINASFLWIYHIAGAHHVRTPGQYYAVNGETGAPLHDPLHSKFLKPLKDTSERIHSSVRIRLARNGPGINDKGNYVAEALTPHQWRDWNGRQRHGWTCERIKSDEDIETAAEAQKDFPHEKKKAQFLWRSRGAHTANDLLLADENLEKFPKILIEDVLGHYEKMLIARDESVMQVRDKLPEKFS